MALFCLQFDLHGLMDNAGFRKHQAMLGLFGWALSFVPTIKNFG
jgi:hypothetical protein